MSKGNKYSIIEGVTFRPYGDRSLITNESLTDELAEMFISKDKTLLGKVFQINDGHKKVTDEVKEVKKK